MYKNTGTAMIFDWDETKNRANRAKHRVSFEAATLVFEDPHAVGVPDRVEEGEERWQTVGMAAGVVLLFAYLSWRGWRGIHSDHLGAKSDAAGEEDLWRRFLEN
jgi:uncharacterized DUF497 family protein